MNKTPLLTIMPAYSYTATRIVLERPLRKGDLVTILPGPYSPPIRCNRTVFMIVDLDPRNITVWHSEQLVKVLYKTNTHLVELSKLARI